MSCKNYNIRDDLKHLSLDEVKKIQKRDSLPFSVAAINVKGDLNISTMIRSAVVFGAEKFYIIGPKRFDRRGCVGAQNYIDLHFIETDPTEFPHLAMHDICMDYVPCLIEQGGKDIVHESFNTFKIPPCFVFGAESTGIPQSIMNLISEHSFEHYSIRQVGVLRSLNVAASCAIVLHTFVNNITTTLLR